MAIYSLSASVFSRSKGHHATAAAAYRAGDIIEDRTVDARFDYSRKGGIAFSEIIAPDSAPSWMRNRADLWNAVEAHERRCDAQLAREILVALPHELDADDRLDLLRRFVTDEFVSLGMVADFSIHEPSRGGDERNHHAHIMLTMRAVEGEGFAKKKAREWNTDDQLQHWREAWAEHCNNALEDAGSDARVDHRSLEMQGVDRQPTEHMGKHATHAERNGKKTIRGDRNRAIEAENQTFDALVADLAAVAAEIRAEQERELDDRFGPAEAAPVRQTSTGEEQAMAQVRQAAAKFAPVQLEAAEPLVTRSLLVEQAPADPRSAAANVRVAAEPFNAAIRARGRVPTLLQEIVNDGVKWWQRASDRFMNLVDDVRSVAQTTWESIIDVDRSRDRSDERDIDR